MKRRDLLASVLAIPGLGFLSAKENKHRIFWAKESNFQFVDQDEILAEELFVNVRDWLSTRENVVLKLTHQWTNVTIHSNGKTSCYLPAYTKSGGWYIGCACNIPGMGNPEKIKKLLLEKLQTLV